MSGCRKVAWRSGLCKIVDERYTPPGFAVSLATKDLRLALAAAEKSQVPMPAASLVHDHLVELAARGWAHKDSNLGPAD
jgi:3-hydroxyisobutyrate dehydrogenase